MTDNAFTLLTLSGIGVPPYSARGVKQSYTMIGAAAQLARTINGTAIDLSEEQFRKYATTIQCDDQDSPALDGIFPGQVLTVEWVAELCYPSSTGGGSAARTAVSGSEREADGFTFYRPTMSMRVVSYQVNKDEYGATVGWTMDLEEV